MVGLTREYKTVLHQIFFSNAEGGFSSLENVYRVAKQRLPGISRSIVRQYLNSIEPYALHKKVVRKHDRRSFLAISPFDSFAADLFFLESQKKQGRKIGALLLVDSFTKFVWCKELANKSADSVLHAFKYILARINQSPKNLFCDKVNRNGFRRPVYNYLRESCEVILSLMSSGIRILQFKVPVLLQKEENTSLFFDYRTKSIFGMTRGFRSKELKSVNRIYFCLINILLLG